MFQRSLYPIRHPIREAIVHVISITIRPVIPGPFLAAIWSRFPMVILSEARTLAPKTKISQSPLLVPLEPGSLELTTVDRSWLLQRFLSGTAIMRS